jgi:predicted dehydrogenase
MLGDLLELRAWGKQDDARSGGEDMIVLGTHVFDLMRLFAGDAEFCTARVLHAGRELTRADARKVKERIGPVAGDEVTAQFGFANGVDGTFASRKRLREQVGHWGIELIGSKTSARILCDVFPSVHVLKRGAWSAEGRTDQWQRFEGDPANVPAAERGFGPANRRLVEDWLEAIEKKREPVCSGLNATKSLEMVMAVYHAALNGARVTLPLKDRSHPLGA